jgi:hypothetical protein
LTAVVAVMTLVRVHAQTMTLATVGGMLHARAPELRVLEGRVLGHLRDGRAVRVTVSLELLRSRGGAAFARAESEFNVSFDLWQERFAVTRTGATPRSVSHLTAQAAETWCLENVTMPLATVSADRRAAVWARVTARPRPEPPVRSEAVPFGIPRLIDALSRRGEQEEPARTVQGGPFQVGS